MPNPYRDAATGRFISLEVSTQQAEQQLAALNAMVKNTQQNVQTVVEQVDKEISATYLKTVNLARNAYTIGLGLVKAGGGSVSYFFRSMISAAFGAIAILTPLIAAEAVTPGMQIQAALGSIELGVAIAATIAATIEQSEIARGLRGAAMSLGAIQSLIGSLDYVI